MDGEVNNRTVRIAQGVKRDITDATDADEHRHNRRRRDNTDATDATDADEHRHNRRRRDNTDATDLKELVEIKELGD